MSKKILLGAICTVLFCGTSATVFAQDNAPSGAASSLLNSADPRAAGMGMATTAVNDNPFGIFGNAASNLLSEKRMGFGYSYNPVMPDYNKGVATHAVISTSTKTTVSPSASVISTVPRALSQVTMPLRAIPSVPTIWLSASVIRAGLWITSPCR